MIRNFLISMVLAFSVQAFATGGWTAVAYDPSSGYGAQSSHGSGFYTQQQAQDYALQRCQAESSGDACTIVGAMYNGWIALASDQNNIRTYAYGTGPDQQSSEAAALNQCAQLGRGYCHIVVEGYSTP